MGLVVTNEGVVPQNDAVVAAVSDRRTRISSALRERRYRSLRKPAIETFPCVFGEGSFRRKANSFFHQNAQRCVFKSRIRQPRHGTTDSPENIRPAKNTFR